MFIFGHHMDRTGYETKQRTPQSLTQNGVEIRIDKESDSEE